LHQEYALWNCSKMAKPENCGSLVVGETTSENEEKVFKMGLTQRALKFGEQKQKAVRRAVNDYQKVKNVIIKDPDISDNFDSVRLSCLEAGLTERCLSSVKSVEELLDVLEMQLVIDLEEANFLFLNQLVKHSKNKEMQVKVRALSIEEICQDVRGIDYLPWAEGWAAELLPVQLKNKKRKEIAEEIARSTDSWSDCRNFLEDLGNHIEPPHHGNYSGLLQREVYPFEKLKNRERLEKGLKLFEETANSAGLLTNASQLNLKIIKSLRSCDLGEAAKNIVNSI